MNAAKSDIDVELLARHWVAIKNEAIRAGLDACRTAAYLARDKVSDRSRLEADVAVDWACTMLWAIASAGYTVSAQLQEQGDTSGSLEAAALAATYAGAATDCEAGGPAAPQI